MASSVINVDKMVKEMAEKEGLRRQPEFVQKVIGMMKHVGREFVRQAIEDMKENGSGRVTLTPADLQKSSASEAIEKAGTEIADVILLSQKKVLKAAEKTEKDVAAVLQILEEL